MPTLVVGMSLWQGTLHMPTTSVGMAPNAATIPCGRWCAGNRCGSFWRSSWFGPSWPSSTTWCARAYPSLFDSGWFPISQFWGPTVHVAGLPYAALFLAALFYALRQVDKLGAWSLWAIGLILIVLGNLEQGGFHAGLIAPLNAFPGQYYHDAVKITSWTQWLRDFNANQPGLFIHSQTHPPLAVLVHYLFLSVSGGSTAVLAGAMTLLASLSVPIVWFCFRAVGLPAARRNTLALLLAVIPAYNIYSSVSLDALVVTAASLFLLGLLVLMRRPDAIAAGVALCTTGFILTNLLTYGGVFLLAVGGLLACREIVLGKGCRLALAVAVSAAAMAALVLLMGAALGYHHVQGFLTASRLENPQGFRGFAEPPVYLITRIMDVGEIALFLSLGCLATLFCRRTLGGSLLDIHDDIVAVVVAAAATLGAMFLAGVYKNGETARTCLFVFPYLLLWFYRAERTVLRDLVAMAGVQTAAMQLFGGYAW